MSQIDWVGGKPERKFKDIRNTRDSVAERKAALALELGELLNKVPSCVRDGSIQVVRQWRITRDAALKVAGNRRSSVEDLTRAIGSMRPYHVGGEK